MNKNFIFVDLSNSFIIESENENEPEQEEEEVENENLQLLIKKNNFTKIEIDFYKSLKECSFEDDEKNFHKTYMEKYENILKYYILSKLEPGVQKTQKIYGGFFFFDTFNYFCKEILKTNYIICVRKIKNKKIKK
jgi:hypothetical protein